MSARRLAWVAGAAAALAWGACGESDRPPRLGSQGGGGQGAAAGAGGALLDAGPRDGPPVGDAPGVCGNVVVPVPVERPNLYIVLDRSGSMLEDLDGKTRHYAARIAIADMLAEIGHRVNYGAAVFPAETLVTGCEPGAEVFATRPGDGPEWRNSTTFGPVLKSLMLTLGDIPPSGGTPTAATLVAIEPRLLALSGRTFVLLVTDGAPNCNGAATCGASECMLNLIDYSDGTLSCPPEGPNCCDPAVLFDGPYNCVDRGATVGAVGRLAAAGIPTYVVGMPGTELYASVLDAAAIAGGTARPAPPYYYPVSSATELTDTFRSIGVAVAVSCSITLGEEPPDRGLVNVYLDTKKVLFDANDGWVWTGNLTLELRGAACAELKSGDVGQVQVVAGCPTEVL
ncbi:MAG: VWA domain-containing protein [Polyangiaceae bacterium]|nr:VWA domain-containing protein [Polyangiaceae bacterium]